MSEYYGLQVTAALVCLAPLRRFLPSHADVQSVKSRRVTASLPFVPLHSEMKSSAVLENMTGSTRLPLCTETTRNTSRAL